jgi:hypothetical protein
MKATNSASNVPAAEVRPIVADESLVAKLRELQQAPWPAGLHRFAPFALDGEESDIAHIAVAWNPVSGVLYAQKIELNKPPPPSRMPERIRADSENWPSRVKPIVGAIRPDYMNIDLAAVPSSTLEGFERRKMLITALIMIDPTGKGSESEYMVNDLIFFDTRLRGRRIAEMSRLLDEGRGFRPYIIKVLTRYLWYGGDQHALLCRAPEQGGKGKERLEPATKPGPLTFREKLARARANANGKVYVRNAKRTDVKDIQRMTEALTEHWAGEQLSLERTRQLINGDLPSGEKLSYRRLQYRYKRIAQAHRLLVTQYGALETKQNLDPRPGTSSALTQGVLEILDVDGFRPKAVIGGLVEGKLVPIDVWIVFAVSRLTGAVRGYEICLSGEESEGYRRCLISALLPIDEHVAALGLDPLPGVLHGNFDGAYVDNGPGKSDRVSKPVTESLGGIMFYPPGARPDLKPVVERFNGIFIRIMAENTAQGYTREHNVLQTTKRRKRMRAKPLTVRELEVQVLQTIDEFNRTTDRSNLRTAEMRRAGADGCGISPAELHDYHQRHRVGDAARVRPADEVYDIFLPWEEAVCREGRVVYKHARFSSPHLVELARAHAMIPGRKGSLPVEVKRVSRFASTLLCRGLDGKVFDLEMIDEDKRRFGNVTWKEMEIACLDDAVRAAKLDAERAKGVAKRVNGAKRLKTKQQSVVDGIERGRGNAYAHVIGSTKARARRNGAAARDAAFEGRVRTAYGLPAEGETTADRGAPQWEPVDADDPLAAAARLIEELYRRDR